MPPGLGSWGSGFCGSLSGFLDYRTTAKPRQAEWIDYTAARPYPGPAAARNPRTWIVALPHLLLIPGVRRAVSVSAVLLLCSALRGCPLFQLGRWGGLGGGGELGGVRPAGACAALGPGIRVAAIPKGRKERVSRLELGPSGSL